MTQIHDVLSELTKNMSNQRKAEVLEVAQKLGLPPDDYYWCGIAALHLYKDYYEAIPAKITAASAQLLADHQQAIALEIERAAALTTERLSAAVQAQINNTATAKTVTENHLTRWTFVLIGLSGFLAGLLLGYYFNQKQVDFARADGYQKGTAAAAFLSKPEGKQAYKWHQDGTLAKLMDCKAPGLARAKDGTCMVLNCQDKKYCFSWPN